jgi:hypothetical protein
MMQLMRSVSICNDAAYAQHVKDRMTCVLGHSFLLDQCRTQSGCVQHVDLKAG